MVQLSNVEALFVKWRFFFANQEEQFYSDKKKCAFLMSMLSGKAIDWAAAVWETERLFRTSYKYFVQQLRDVFEYPAGGKDISTQLLHMSQGNRTAADYAIEFRTLAAQSGWNDISLKAVFRQSLNFDLQTELACKGENCSFTEYITLAIKIDNLMRNAPKRKIVRPSQASALVTHQLCHVPQPTSMPSQEPMQLGFSRLTEEERTQRRQLNLCYYCCETGHHSIACPHKARRNTKITTRVSVEQFSLLPTKSLTFPVRLSTESTFIDLTVLIDSGAALNLIHKDIISKFNLPTQPCVPSIKISAVNNTLIGDGINHQTQPLQLHIGLFHQEAISLYVIDSPRHEIILGYPWLSVHDPVFSWHHGELTHWSRFCQTHCMHSAIIKPCLTTSIESPNTTQTTEIPSCYEEFSEVFSKIKATQLPPHRPWDCAIDLLTNAMPPKSKVYPLSRNETQAMEEYIEEAMNSGFIRPSTSPAAAGFFFVEKKDGGLRLCIDYRGLTLRGRLYRRRYQLVFFKTSAKDTKNTPSILVIQISVIHQLKL